MSADAASVASIEASSSDDQRVRWLLVSSAARSWALPLACLSETMRPQPVERVDGVDDYVLGLAMIRGVALPVVALSRLIGEQPEQHERFVTLRAGPREIALAVADVIGIYELDAAAFTLLPPLVSSAQSQLIDALARRDLDLVRVLSAARLIPDEVWQKLACARGQRS